MGAAAVRPVTIEAVRRSTVALGLSAGLACGPMPGDVGAGGGSGDVATGDETAGASEAESGSTIDCESPFGASEPQPLTVRIANETDIDLIVPSPYSGFVRQYFEVEGTIAGLEVESFRGWCQKIDVDNPCPPFPSAELECPPRQDDHGLVIVGPGGVFEHSVPVWLTAQMHLPAACSDQAGAMCPGVISGAGELEVSTWGALWNCEDCPCKPEPGGFCETGPEPFVQMTESTAPWDGVAGSVDLVFR